MTPQQQMIFRNIAVFNAAPPDYSALPPPPRGWINIPDDYWGTEGSDQNTFRYAMQSVGGIQANDGLTYVDPAKWNAFQAAAKPTGAGLMIVLGVLGAGALATFAGIGAAAGVAEGAEAVTAGEVVTGGGEFFVDPYDLLVDPSITYTAPEVWSDASLLDTVQNLPKQLPGTDSTPEWLQNTPVDDVPIDPQATPGESFPPRYADPTKPPWEMPKLPGGVSPGSAASTLLKALTGSQSHPTGAAVPRALQWNPATQQYEAAPQSSNSSGWLVALSVLALVMGGS